MICPISSLGHHQFSLVWVEDYVAESVVFRRRTVVYHYIEVSLGILQGYYSIQLVHMEACDIRVSTTVQDANGMTGSCEGN